jgi:Mce-associated membrane protein
VSLIDADRVDDKPPHPDGPTDADDARALTEVAEAEAAAAAATAHAARARARALKLRRQAEAAEADTGGVAAETTPLADTTAEDTADANETEPKSQPDHQPDRALDDTLTVDENDDAVTTPGKKPANASARWRLRPNWKVLGTVTVALCTGVLLAVSGHLIWQHRHALHEQQLEAEYAAAGRQGVVTLMSLDFNKAKEDADRIIDDSTGAFRDEFKNQAANFVQVAQNEKVIVAVTVNFVAVESMTDDVATVLVSATSRVTNAAGAQQEPRSWRLAVNLQREGGRAKISKIEFLP